MGGGLDAAGTTPPLPGVSSAEFITLLVLCELPPEVPTTYCGSWLYFQHSDDSCSVINSLWEFPGRSTLFVCMIAADRVALFASFSESISRLDGGGAYRFARMCISSLSAWFDPDHVHPGDRRGW